MIWFSIPRLPVTPAKPDDILLWLVDFRREVERVLTEIQITGVTRSLVGWRGDQTVATAFTIDPNAPVITLNATFAPTSSATEAIKDGLDGQFLFLKNSSTNNVIIQHGANTVLAGGTYLTLTQNDAVALIWDGSDWVQLAPVSVN